jgi:hypothetical protein
MFEVCRRMRKVAVGRWLRWEKLYTNSKKILTLRRYKDADNSSSSHHQTHHIQEIKHHLVYPALNTQHEMATYTLTVDIDQIWIAQSVLPTLYSDAMLTLTGLIPRGINCVLLQLSKLARSITTSLLIPQVRHNLEQ